MRRFSEERPLVPVYAAETASLIGVLIAIVGVDRRNVVPIVVGLAVALFGMLCAVWAYGRDPERVRASIPEFRLSTKFLLQAVALGLCFTTVGLLTFFGGLAGSVWSLVVCSVLAGPYCMFVGMGVLSGMALNATKPRPPDSPERRPRRRPRGVL